MKTSTIVIVLGSVCGAIGLLSIFGYVFGIERMFNWNKGTPMAVNTSVACLIIGFVLIGIGFDIKRNGKNRY